MRIKLPVAAPVSYNPAYYLEWALIRLGHSAEVIDQGWLYDCGPDDADLFLCVDSGGPLNIPPDVRPKACMWYIDSRRNHDPAIRNPSDDETALQLLSAGGLVFQAQERDWRRVFDLLETNKTEEGDEQRERLLYLPLAADPDVWAASPKAGRQHQLAFVGNCFDAERNAVLWHLSEDGLLHWPGAEKAIMQEGAAVYRSALAGLNFPSWFGTPECYDVNMRVFEVLSCGIPLITNRLPELSHLGIEENNHVLTYPTITTKEDGETTVHATIAAIKPLLTRLVNNPEQAVAMGSASRKLIESRHTYAHRALDILSACHSSGII